MEWQAERVLTAIERQVAQRIQSAAFHLQNQIRVNLSVAGTKTAGSSYVGKGAHYTATQVGPAERGMPGVEGSRSQLNAFGVAGKRYRKGRRIYGANPSAPGDYPHKQYGNLRASIATDFDQETLTARIGTTIKYARPLEFGSRKMAARPFLRRTLANEKVTIQQILETGKAGSENS